MAATRKFEVGGWPVQVFAKSFLIAGITVYFEDPQVDEKLQAALEVVLDTGKREIRKALGIVEDD